MAKIPGWAYLIVGGLVAGVSFYVNKVYSSNMTFFVYIGGLFIGIGIFKTLIYYMTKEKDPRQQEREIKKREQEDIMRLKKQQMQLQNLRQQQMQNHMEMQRQQIQRNQRQYQSANGSYCQRCRIHLNGYENFCPGCGLRLR